MPPEPSSELDARFSNPGASASSWAEVRRTIEEAELFWITTVRTDGRPHVTPLPAVWLDDRVYFCTGGREQKAVNLQRNASCALTTGTNLWKAGLDVVVEGEAERVTDEGRLRELAVAWETKYRGDWHFDVDNGAFHGEGGEALVFEVRPSKILAFAKGEFAQTRFRFPRTRRRETRPVPDDDLPRIGAPATRALAAIGVTRLSQVVDHTEADLLALHGFGPRALRILREALADQGLSLAASPPR